MAFLGPKKGGDSNYWSRSYQSDPHKSSEEAADMKKDSWGLDMKQNQWLGRYSQRNVFIFLFFQ